jgi:hypothetical protein
MPLWLKRSLFLLVAGMAAECGHIGRGEAAQGSDDQIPIPQLPPLGRLPRDHPERARP